MSAAAAARSVFRSSAARRTGVKLAGGGKPTTAQSAFRVPTQKPLSARVFRSPVEMSCAVSMYPFHTATASALLTSMLSATPRHYGWTLEEPSRTLAVGNPVREYELQGYE